MSKKALRHFIRKNSSAGSDRPFDPLWLRVIKAVMPIILFLLEHWLK